MSFLDITQQSIQAAMSGSMQRQSLLTNNLVNADTPGFTPRDVNFQQTLKSALQSGGSVSDLSFQSYAAPQVNGPNGNTVSADQTNAQVAENAILYQDLAQIAAARDQMVRQAISTSG